MKSVLVSLPIGFDFGVLDLPCSGHPGLPPSRLYPTAASLTPTDAAGGWFVSTDLGVPLHEWTPMSHSLPHCLSCVSQHGFKIPPHFPVACVPTGAKASSAWLSIFRSCEFHSLSGGQEAYRRQRLLSAPSNVLKICVAPSPGTLDPSLFIPGHCLGCC